MKINFLVYFYFIILLCLPQTVVSMHCSKEFERKVRLSQMSSSYKQAREQYSIETSVTKILKSEEKFHVMIVGRGLNQGLYDLNVESLFNVEEVKDLDMLKTLTGKNSFITYVDVDEFTYDAENSFHTQLMCCFSELNKIQKIHDFFHMIIVDPSTFKFLEEAYETASLLLKKGGLFVRPCFDGGIVSPRIFTENLDPKVYGHNRIVAGIAKYTIDQFNEFSQDFLKTKSKELGLALCKTVDNSLVLRSKHMAPVAEGKVMGFNKDRDDYLIFMKK